MKTEFGDDFRFWRVKLILTLGLVILYRKLIAPRWGAGKLGLRLFFVCLFLLLSF